MSPTAPFENYYVVKTLGCKANLYDSQLIEAELQRRGWRPLPGRAGGDELAGARLCVVNSCTVTDEADRQSRRLASRLGRDNPAARVVMTGCGAEVDPERLARSKGIHYVVGNQDKPRMVSLILEALERGVAEDAGASDGGQVLGEAKGYAEMLSRHPLDREWPVASEAIALPPVHLAGGSDKTRAFLKVQEGCNSFCTYCIIPYGRGPSRSLPAEKITSHIHNLVESGIQEVVLTATNLGDYGSDEGGGPGSALAPLLESIFARTAVARVRLSSLDPAEITPELRALMAREPRFCPHFHVSLQAMHPRTLKMMKRKYGVAEAEAGLRALASLRPAAGGRVFVGMDLITGFPGETAAEFEESYARLAELPWSRLHVFPYSEREGTPATRLPGAVPPAERARRARKLAALSLARMAEHYGAAGGELEALLEKPVPRPPAGFAGEVADGTAWISGYSPDYIKVWVPVPAKGAEALRNRVARVQLRSLLRDPVAGEVTWLGRLAGA